MKGFSVIVVLIFLLAIIPILSVEGSLVKKSGELQTRFITLQEYKNTQEDILRTFSELAEECSKTKDKRLCELYLSEWMKYWASKGFNIEYGELADDFHVIKTVKPSLLGGVLRPDGNVTQFGIVLKKGTQRIVIRRGDWGCMD